MNHHAIIGTDFSKAVSEIIQNSEMFKSFGINEITLIHILNLREVIMVERFTIEGLEEKLAQQKSLLESKGFLTETELKYGIPYIELEKKRKESDAGMIIIGSHGRTGSSSRIGGTVADVLQNLKSPVLVIPLKKKVADNENLSSKSLYQYEKIFQELEKYEPDWELKNPSLLDHILLPTDFSDFSENAFQWIRQRRISLPKVTLLHVQDEVKIGGHLHDKLEDFNKIDAERLSRLEDSFKDLHPETKVDVKIIYGKPTEVILNFIREENVTLTLMGSQGRGFFSDIFIGSVSHQVARNANSNVLIIPLP